jgi:hypothetical protein
MGQAVSLDDQEVGESLGLGRTPPPQPIPAKRSGPPPLPQQASPGFKRRRLIAAGAGLAAVCFLGCAGVLAAVLALGGPPASPFAEPVKVSADDLFQQYREDLVAADGKYLGRPLVVEEVKGKVEKDEAGRYFIGTVNRRMLAPPRSGQARIKSTEEYARSVYEAAASTRYLPGVILYLRPSSIGKLQGLDPNVPVSLRGTCRGTRRASAGDPAFEVVLEDCTLP